MARTKKRYEISVTEEKDRKNPTFYQAGIYTRLSQERKEEYRDKSNSLAMQEELCIKEAKEKGISIVKVYQDYEYTGTNFKRPAFNEMMADIKERKINCILVKDLSRFGREYLEIGNYIEKVFPFLGVRFISVNDHFDTENKTDDKKSFEITIKNIINDLYAKDISKKVSSTKQEKMKQGYFIGTFAPYGYKAVRKDKGKVLIVDEKVREVVELIFDLAYKGTSQIEIARELTKKYTTPWQYMKTGEVIRSKENKKQWNACSISQVLKNEVYIGNMVQGMNEKKSERKENGKYKPIQEWVKVEHTHEAIVEKEKFFEVQRIRNERVDIARNVNHLYSKQRKNIKNKYAGLLKCQVCQRELKAYYREYSKKSEGIYNKKQYSFFCRGEDMLKLEKIHTSIWESELDKIILSAINDLIEQWISKAEIKDKVHHFYQIALKEEENKLKNQKKKIDALMLDLQDLYESYVKGGLVLSGYQEKKEEVQKQVATFHEEIAMGIERKETLKIRKKKLEEFIGGLLDREKRESDYLDTELLHLLIDFIEVGKSKEIVIHFKFDLEEEKRQIMGGWKNE